MSGFARRLQALEDAVDALMEEAKGCFHEYHIAERAEALAILSHEFRRREKQ